MKLVNNMYKPMGYLLYFSENIINAVVITMKSKLGRNPEVLELVRGTG
jgi:hypothetical protein